MTAIKNKRLAQYDRDRLYRFASEQVAAHTDSSELDAAYNKAADAIAEIVANTFPQKDMKVLAKYDVAVADQCIYISTGGSNYDRFEFRDGDARIQLRPSKSCNRMPIAIDGDCEQAWRFFSVAASAAKDAHNARVRDFWTIINNAKTFNELVEAWPAAEAMRERIVGTATALTVLSAEVVARVKADPAYAP